MSRKFIPGDGEPAFEFEGTGREASVYMLPHRAESHNEGQTNPCRRGGTQSVLKWNSEVGD